MRLVDGGAARSLLFGFGARAFAAGIATSLTFACGNAADEIHGGDARFDAAEPASPADAHAPEADAADATPDGDAAETTDATADARD